jgi:hypothetical protein
MKHLYGYNVHGLQVMPLPEPPCYCQQGFVTLKSTGGAKSTSRQIEDLIAEAKALATPRYELPRPKTPTIQWCNARSVEGWNICLWGNPKLTVVCGKCMGTTAQTKLIKLEQSTKFDQFWVF